MKASRVSTYALLAAASIMVAFPLLIALSYSFMSESEISTFPPPLFPVAPTLDNYGKVLATIAVEVIAPLLPIVVVALPPIAS